MDASSADFPSLYFRMQLQQPIFSGTFSSKDSGIYPLVCSYFPDYSEWPFLRKSLCNSWTLVFRKSNGTCRRSWLLQGVLSFWELLYKEVSTFSNANMVFSARSHRRLSGRTCHGIKGKFFPFFPFFA